MNPLPQVACERERTTWVRFDRSRYKEEKLRREDKSAIKK